MASSLAHQTELIGWHTVTYVSLDGKEPLILLYLLVGGGSLVLQQDSEYYEHFYYLLAAAMGRICSCVEGHSDLEEKLQ